LSHPLISLLTYILPGLPLIILINKSLPLTISDPLHHQIKFNLRQSYNKLQHNPPLIFLAVILKLQSNLHPLLYFCLPQSKSLHLLCLLQKTSWTILKNPILSQRELLSIYCLAPLLVPINSYLSEHQLHPVRICILHVFLVLFPQHIVLILLLCHLFLVSIIIISIISYDILGSSYSYLFTRIFITHFMHMLLFIPLFLYTTIFHA